MAIPNGFTLIELLAAMVVGSLLLVGLSWLAGSLGREARGDDADLAVRQIAKIAPTIDGLARSAVAGEEGGASLDIATTHLSTNVAPPASFGPVGPVKMALQAQHRSDGDALLLSFVPARPGAILPAAVTHPVVLASGFRTIRFEEGDAEADEPPYGNIIFVDQRNVSRSLMFATHVNANGACQFDPVSLACR